MAWWGAFVLLGLVAHGTLLLDDGLYTDDWVYLAWMREPGGLRELLGLHLSFGYPMTGLFHLAFAALPDPAFGHKLAMVAGLVITAGLVAKLCRAANVATPAQAFSVGLLALVAPAHRALEPFNFTPEFAMYLPLFLTAALLVVRAERLVGHPRRWRRGLALLLFSVSFQLNSLLVPYVGLCAIMLALRWAEDWSRLREWLAHAWPFLLLPWAFWGVRLLLKAAGIVGAWPGARGHNELVGRIPPIALVFTEAVRTYALMAWAWARPATLAWLVGALVVTTVLVRRAFVPKAAPRSSGARLALLGAALFVLGLFPYAAVGKGLGPPGAHFFGHYGVLLGPPLGLVAVGLLVLIFGGLTRPAWGLVLFLLGLGTVEAVTTHLHWQAEGIKWKSVCQLVGRSQDVRQANIVVVADRWPLGMHDSIAGGDVGRVVVQGRLFSGRRPFSSSWPVVFNYWCAPGAPKIAFDIPLPAAAEYPSEATRVVRNVLHEQVRAGRWSREELREARTVLADAARTGAPAVRSEILRRWPILLEGLARSERSYGAWEATEALRARALLRLAGFPVAPAVPSRFWQEREELERTIMIPRPAVLPERARSVLVLVEPGASYRAVPVGDPGWWPEVRRLWMGDKLARLRGPEARVAWLDHVARVEAVRLAW